MKILILLVYYNRPKMVRYALESITRASKYHNDFEVAFIDDGSDVPGRPIACEMLADLLHRVRFYDVFYPQPTQSSHHGKYLNQAVRDSDAEVGLVLCDDDALTDKYLMILSAYYEQHPEVMSTYCHVETYNPFERDPWHPIYNPLCRTYDFTKQYPPTNKVTSASLGWRIRVNKGYGIWFPENTLRALDLVYAQAIFQQVGYSYFCGCIGQYKGVHHAQLSRRTHRGTVQEIDLP